jgi:chemotaxis protein MotB
MARKPKPGPPPKKENSERWLLTYADMITLLMLFFIILYSMSTVNPAKYQELAQAFQSVFSGGPLQLFATSSTGGAGVLTGLNPGQKVATARAGQNQGTGGSSTLRQQATSTLQNLVKAGRVKIVPTENGFAISMISDSFFAPGSATLAPDAMPALQEVSGFLGQISNSIVVEGYTDNLPVNTARWTSNWQLASERALAVLYSLEDYGTPTERLSASSYGETRPVVSNDTPEGRAQNRRVDIVIVEKQ